MTYEELRDAARLIREYSSAVESTLYINMRLDRAHHLIETAERIATRLEEEAMFKLRTDVPDLG